MFRDQGNPGLLPELRKGSQISAKLHWNEITIFKMHSLRGISGIRLEIMFYGSAQVAIKLNSEFTSQI